MNTFVKNDDPQWIDVAPGQRRKIRAYNGELMLVEVSFDEGAVGADHTHPHSRFPIFSAANSPIISTESPAR